MGILQRLRLALRAAWREWSSHRGVRAEREELPAFAIGPLVGRGPYEFGKAPLGVDKIRPPYYGEFLADVSGHKFALRRRVIRDGMTRMIDEVLPGDIEIDYEWLDKAQRTAWLMDECQKDLKALRGEAS